MSGDYHGLFLGGIGEVEWDYFWEKRARGGACRGSARSVVLGMVAILCKWGCHTVVMRRSFSGDEAAIQCLWKEGRIKG